MEVNFVFQVRSFHRLKREIQISANAQALWLELFGLFNERHFPDVLPVSTTHLSAMLGISSDTVIRARKELTEAGLIETVGDRRGRQHTTYRIKYFTIQPAYGGASVVDNSGGNVDNSASAYFCDASQDTNCDANVMPYQKTQTAAQDAAQPAVQPAAQTGVYAAPEDTNCGTYINDKQRRYKLKAKRNLKRTPRIQKKAHIIQHQQQEKCARDMDFHDDTEDRESAGALHYNDAWRTDERARRRTAQNVIDACAHPVIRAEDGLNELLCRYMAYGMTPEQELSALERWSEGVKAVNLLDDAAYSLGVYHAAFEAGKLEVHPRFVHAYCGDLAMAKMQQRREAFNVFFAEVQNRIQAEYGERAYSELPRQRQCEIREYVGEVMDRPWAYRDFEQQYAAIKRKIEDMGVF